MSHFAVDVIRDVDHWMWILDMWHIVIGDLFIELFIDNLNIYFIMQCVFLVPSHSPHSSIFWDF